ncbi:RNA-directed DNA polymerase, eukaryota, reverse transcriptase zinc-binding domain protein [Tanacetum coccineum]
MGKLRSRARESVGGGGEVRGGGSKRESDGVLWKEQEGCMGKSGKVDRGGMNDEEIDVFNDDSGMAECLNMNEMMGIDRGILEVRNFISAQQYMLFELRTVNSSRRMFCAIIYAANDGMERRTLWKDLMIYKRIMGTEAWFLMGDMNVTLFPNEHSAGCSNMTSYMCDFKDCVNSIDVEDIASTGLFYTWTKNLFKAKEGDTSGVLKKLDRIMGNEEFIDKFSQAHDIFLPYLISDHCPNVLVFPNVLQAKKKGFKFANFVVDKGEFMSIVRKHRNEDHEGCHLFKIVKKLRSMKKDLKKFTWKDGNIFDNVKRLRDHLKEFLEAILKGFGFHSKMVNWIIKCVTTTSFSICVNGKSCGYFQGGRGLRQGDPMSPYLFILVMEILTLLVEKRVNGSSDFKYHYGCKDMRLTYFCFADDLIMFSHRDKDSVMVLQKAIEEFGSISGLLPNYNKSTIIFGSMDEEKKQRILSSVPFKLEKLPVKYLGMPLTSRELQLNASVRDTHTHIVYWTSVFLLPQAVINEINKILKGFLWNQGESSKGKQRFPGGLFVLLKMKMVSVNGLINRLTNILNNNIILNKIKSDKLVWRSKDGKEGSFGVKQAYEDFRSHDDEDMDSHKHLFFKCGYAEEFWKLAMAKMGVVYDVMEWNDLVNHVARLYCGNSIDSVIRRLGLAVGVYLIWKERNGRIFRDEKRSIKELAEVFADLIRTRLLSLKFKKSAAVLRVQKIWNVCLNGGESVGPALLKAIEESRHAVIIFSKNYKRKFGEAFATQEMKNLTKMETWRKALVDASNISGWEPKNVANG